MNLTTLENSFSSIGHNIWSRAPGLVLTFIVGYFLIKIVKAVLHSAIKVSRTNASMKGVLISVVDVALWLFLVAAIMEQLGLSEIALALSSTVAIAGLAISTGMSSFVQDMVSGLFLADDKDFNTGDRIKVQEVEGSVERIDARKIRIRDDAGALHIFPNSVFDKEEWIVIKQKEGQ